MAAGMTSSSDNSIYFFSSTTRLSAFSPRLLQHKTEKSLNTVVTYMLHMEHKDYRLEIVNLLLQGRNHARGIAPKIGTNHMLVARKMKELARDNAVDFVQEGKNRSYFLKKTAEARACVFISENYKLILALSRYPGLRGIIEKIQKDKRIRMAILFGSYAKGLATKNSDIDIYIETGKRNIRKELRMLDSRLSIKIGEYDKKNPLMQEIEKNHIVIKGIEEYYEKNKFFD